MRTHTCCPWPVKSTKFGEITGHKVRKAPKVDKFAASPEIDAMCQFLQPARTEALFSKFTPGTELLADAEKDARDGAEGHMDIPTDKLPSVEKACVALVKALDGATELAGRQTPKKVIFVSVRTVVVFVVLLTDRRSRRTKRNPKLRFKDHIFCTLEAE